MRYQDRAADQARVTSRRHCLLVPVAEDLETVWARAAVDPTSDVLGNRAIDRGMVGARDNREIVLTIACQVKVAIDRTLVDRDNPVIVLAISADQADREIARVTLVDRDDRVTGPEILDDPGNQAETLFKICRVESATGDSGRIGVRNTAATFATGGTTTQATSATGMATTGGMTTTSTGPTIRASDIGGGRRGMR